MNILDQVFNPDSYLDAFDSTSVPIEELSPDLRMVRLAVALGEDDLALADELLTLLRRQSLVGYESFQLATASMWVAVRRSDPAGFDRALKTWLYGRKKYPGNWISEVLEAPEFAPFLAAIDPQRLVPPVPPKPRAITKLDRSFVADLVESRLCAVDDNLHWLREMGIDKPASAIVKRYRLVGVDIGLGEATFASKDEELPSLTVTLDNDGNYTGSFIAH